MAEEETAAKEAAFKEKMRTKFTALTSKQSTHKPQPSEATNSVSVTVNFFAFSHPISQKTTSMTSKSEDKRQPSKVRLIYL